MRNSIKKFITYLAVYLLISIGYLVYCYIRDGMLNWDYIVLAVFCTIVYSVTYYLLDKFGDKD